MDTLPQAPPAPPAPVEATPVISPAKKSNAGWFIAVGVAALLVVGVAAASAGSKHSATTSTSNANTAPLSQADSLRAGVLTSGVAYTLSSDDSAVDAGAETICSEARALTPIDNTDAYYLANQFSAASGLSTMDAAKVVGVVLGVYCSDVQLLG